MFLEVYWVMDDVTLEVSKRGQGSGQMSPMEGMFPMCAGLGINLWYADHCPGSESPVIRQNTASHIFLGATEDSRLIKEMLRLTKEHFDRVAVLMPGEEVVFVPGTWPLAVYGKFPYVPEGHISEEERLIRKERFFADVEAIKPGQVKARTGQGESQRRTQDETRQASGERQKPSWVRRGLKLLGFRSHGRSEERLSGEERKVLVIVSHEWGIGLLVVYRRAGMAPRRGQQVLRRMESKGLIRIHTFPGRGRGGRFRVAEVTDKGWKVLEALGIERPKALTQGGWEHELAARLVGKEGQRLGYHVDYEVTMGDRRFDCVWTSRQGRKVFYEVEMSRLDHAVDNLVKALRIPGVAGLGNRLVLVVRDKGTAEKARKRLGKSVRRLEQDGVLTIKCVSDFIKINI